MYSFSNIKRARKLAARCGHIFECEIKGNKYFYCVKMFFLLRSSMVEVHSLNIGGGKIMKTMTNNCHSEYLSFQIGSYS